MLQKSPIDFLFDYRVDRYLEGFFVGLCSVTVLTVLVLTGILIQSRALAADSPLVITYPTNASQIATTNPVFTGTGPPNKQFYLVLDGALKGPVAIDGSGNWTYTPGTLATGSHTIKEVLVDGTGLLGDQISGDLSGGQISLNSGAITGFNVGMSSPETSVLDETDHRLFIDDATPNIKVFDSQTNALLGSIDPYPSSPYPSMQGTSMYFDSTRSKLYIFTGYGVVTVNPTTLAITNKVTQALSSIPAIAVSPTTSKVYYSGSGQLYEFDRDAETITAVSGVTTVSNARIKFSPDGSVLYYQTWSDINGDVRTLSPSTNTVSTSFVTQANDYVADSSNNLYTISASGVFNKFNSSGTLLSTHTGAGTYPLTINPGLTKVYTTTKSYDIATDTMASPTMNWGYKYVDPTGAFVYSDLGDPADTGNTIYVYDATGDLLSTIASRPGSHQILFASTGNMAYVMNPQDGSYSVIDTSTPAITANISSGLRYSNAHATLPNGSKSYVLNQGNSGGSTVQVTNSAGTLLSTIELPGSAWSGLSYAPMALSPSGADLYVLVTVYSTQLAYTEQLVDINTSTDSIASSLQLSTNVAGDGAQSNTLVIDQTAGLAYVARSGGGVATVNLTTGAVASYLTSSIPSPGRLILSSDGTKLYVMGTGDPTPVYAITTSNMTLAAQTSIPKQNYDLGLSQDQSMLYVTGSDIASPFDYYVYELSSTTLSTLTSLNLGGISGNASITVPATGGIFFATTQNSMFILDNSSLFEYGSFAIHSPGFVQPATDIATPDALELDPSAYFYSEADSTFTIVTSTPSPTPSATPTPTPSTTPTPTPSVTPTPTPTATPTPSQTATPTPTPTTNPTPSSTPHSTPTPKPTTKPSNTPKPTPTPLPSSSPSSTPITTSPTPSATPSPCEGTPGASSHCTPLNNHSAENAPAHTPVAVLNNYSNFETPSGHVVGLTSGQNVAFKTNTNSNDTHHVTLSSVGSNSVDLIIASNPIDLHLVLGDTEKVDVDGDGQWDIAVTLSSITNGQAVLKFVNLDVAATTTPQKSSSTAGPSLFEILALVVAIIVLGVVGAAWIYIRARKQSL